MWWVIGVVWPYWVGTERKNLSVAHQATESDRPATGISGRLAMRGRILDFTITTNQGLIAGDDGLRYTFIGAEWKTAAVLPKSGTPVDFVASGDTATEVYVFAHAGAGTADDPYRGLYCSSDERMILGLCGGLAHKFGIPVTTMRAIVFVFGVFVLWVPYLIGIFLPKVPTRGVPRPM
jgi:phage shock protein PspC (stress-responsive transcriptional regulator)